MAVNIIEYGRNVAKKYTFKCDICKCVYTATDDLVKKEPDFRNGTIISHNCPCCECRNYYRFEV